MESSKIKTKIGFVLFLSVLVYACDVFEQDPDVTVPDVEVTTDELAVLANGSAFIDLAKHVSANVPVKFSVTVPTQHGLLEDHGEGLLRYRPTIGAASGSDAFEFTIYSQKDELLLVDTVVIAIESDSTQLPCGIYTVDDYAYNVQSGTSVTVDVLDNDMICGIDESDLRVSVYRPTDEYPPYSGSARVEAGQIVYEPGAEFAGARADKLIYKIESVSDESLVGYGMVYFAGVQECIPVADQDHFTFDPTASFESIFLTVFQNDTTCLQNTSQYTTIKMDPAQGVATLMGGGIEYTPFSFIDRATIDDSLIYQICVDGYCVQARASIKANTPAPCQIAAFRDIAYISPDSSNVVTMDVLANDQLCSELISFEIEAAPQHGNATITPNNLLEYIPDSSGEAMDSVVYKICDDTGCSSTATVYKRQ